MDPTRLQTQSETRPTTPIPADNLLPLVYDGLTRIADGYFARHLPGEALQPTALLREVYTRLLRDGQIHWRDRTGYYVAGAAAVRRLFVEHARARASAGEVPRLTLGTIPHGGAACPDIDVLALDEALSKLSRLSDRKARVVELRWFGGLTFEETASALRVASTTVQDDWAFCRAWLGRELDPNQGH